MTPSRTHGRAGRAESFAAGCCASAALDTAIKTISAKDLILSLVRLKVDLTLFLFLAFARRRSIQCWERVAQILAQGSARPHHLELHHARATHGRPRLPRAAPAAQRSA